MTLIILGLIFSIIVTALFYFFIFQNAFLILIFIGAFILFLVLFMLTAYIISLLFKTVKTDKDGKVTKKEPPKIYARFTYIFTDFVKYLFRTRVKIINKELLPKDEPFLLVCNHQSLMDPILIMSSFKRTDIYYIMKKQIRNIPIIGRWLQEAGYHYLDRDNNRKGFALILDCISDLKNGKNIGLFIEGTRSKGPNLGEFHDASLKMALKSKVKIVVLCLDNCYKIKKNYPFRKTKVVIKVCDILEYDKYKDLTTGEISESIKSIMQSNLDLIRNK